MTKISRTKGFLVLSFCALFLFLSPADGACGKPHVEMDSILRSAESFFKALKSKDHVKAWSLMSARSKETVVTDIVRASGSSGEGLDRERIASDLRDGGQIAAAYWDGFLSNFDPDTVLEQSRWEMGPIRDLTAEINITYKKSTGPARLRMFKEGGEWKVGLAETFPTKRR